MKHAILASVVLTIALAAIAASQEAQRTQVPFSAALDGSTVVFTADSIEKRPDLHTLQLRGNVEIRTKYLEIRAAQATFNEKTTEIEARGIVHIKLIGTH